MNKDDIKSKSIGTTEISDPKSNPFFDKSVKFRMVALSDALRVEKTGWHPKGQYYYFTPEDIINPIKPLLNYYSLFCHFNVKRTKKGMNKATLVISDANNNDDFQIYTMEVEDIDTPMSNKAQKAAALRTFCKKYLLMDAFNISDDGDDIDNDDTNNENDAGNRNDALEELKAKLAQNVKLAVKQYKVPSSEINEILIKYSKNNTGKLEDMTQTNIKKALTELNNLVKAK